MFQKKIYYSHNDLSRRLIEPLLGNASRIRYGWKLLKTEDNNGRVTALVFNRGKIDIGRGKPLFARSTPVITAKFSAAPNLIMPILSTSITAPALNWLCRKRKKSSASSKAWRIGFSSTKTLSRLPFPPRKTCKSTKTNWRGKSGRKSATSAGLNRLLFRLTGFCATAAPRLKWTGATTITVPNPRPQNSAICLRPATGLIKIIPVAWKAPFVGKTRGQIMHQVAP